MPKLSHVELNVSHYARSIRFYDLVLSALGWSRLNCRKDFTAYSDGHLKIILCPTDPEHLSAGFHRKRVGLNHLAFYAESKSKVDQFHQTVLVKNQIKTLYTDSPSGDQDYYSVLFEDPDRIKLEVVYAPKYCDPHSWPSNLKDDFDPK